MSRANVPETCAGILGACLAHVVWLGDTGGVQGLPEEGIRGQGCKFDSTQQRYPGCHPVGVTSTEGAKFQVAVVC